MTRHRISWRDLAFTLGPYLLLVAVAFWIAFHFIRPAPPDTIVIASGPPSSIFQVTSERYRKSLAREGVTLRILTTQGSLDNLKRLGNPQEQVDVGFVQGGLADLGDRDNLLSLGSIFYEPVWVFYKAPHAIARLSELHGRRIAIGRVGSGTRVLAETLLRANGIDAKPPTTLLDMDGQEAEEALLEGHADAAFLMGDSATADNIRVLLHARGIRLFDFAQGDAYVRRFPYLGKLLLPAGSLDLGANSPAEPLTLIAPTVELIVRPDLHPAISDMLIEAAREVHGRPNLLQSAGEFPAPLEHEYRLSDDAVRYYKSGKGFAYKHLPFWLASLLDRTLIMLVPTLVVLIPGVKIVPWLYRWRVSGRIYKRYGELMALERAASGKTTPEERAQMLKELDEIEERVINVKIPGSVADQLYILREHIGFVRARLLNAGGGEK